MAEASPGGLFGPTVDELRQLIDERGRADTLALHANAVNPLGIVAGNIANAGRSFGGALEALGGYERPELVRARKMNEARQAVLSMGISPEADPIGFARAASRELSRRGLGDEAFGAALYAKKMQDEAAATEWEKEAKRGDWQNRLDVERMRGEYDLSVAGMRGGGSGGGGGSGFGGGAPKAYDQNEAKAFAEQFMRSPEAQALYQTPGVLYGTNLDEKALQVAADEFGREVETYISLGMPAGIAYNTAMARRTSGRGGGVGGQADPGKAARIKAIKDANKAVLGHLTDEEQTRVAEEADKKKQVRVQGGILNDIKDWFSSPAITPQDAVNESGSYIPSVPEPSASTEGEYSFSNVSIPPNSPMADFNVDNISGVRRLPSQPGPVGAVPSLVKSWNPLADTPRSAPVRAAIEEALRTGHLRKMSMETLISLQKNRLATAKDINDYIDLQLRLSSATIPPRRETAQGTRITLEGLPERAGTSPTVTPSRPLVRDYGLNLSGISPDELMFMRPSANKLTGAAVLLDRSIDDWKRRVAKGDVLSVDKELIAFWKEYASELTKRDQNRLRLFAARIGAKLK